MRFGNFEFVISVQSIFQSWENFIRKKNDFPFPSRSSKLMLLRYWTSVRFNSPFTVDFASLEIEIERTICTGVKVVIFTMNFRISICHCSLQTIISLFTMEIHEKKEILNFFEYMQVNKKIAFIST
jgi:hypothetical protein